MSNYFSFYGLKPSPLLDEKALRRAYLQESRNSHPDHHQDDQSALERAEYNNRAYEVLKDAYKRLSYLLEILDAKDSSPLPPSFLMEMMDLNEALAELEFEPDAARAQALLEQIQNLENEAFEALRPEFEAFDYEALDEALVKKIALFEKKLQYFLRIRKKALIFVTH